MVFVLFQNVFGCLLPVQEETVEDAVMSGCYVAPDPDLKLSTRARWLLCFDVHTAYCTTISRGKYAEYEFMKCPVRPSVVCTLAWTLPSPTDESAIRFRASWFFWQHVLKRFISGAIPYHFDDSTTCRARCGRLALICSPTSWFPSPVSSFSDSLDGRSDRDRNSAPSVRCCCCRSLGVFDVL